MIEIENQWLENEKNETPKQSNTVVPAGDYRFVVRKATSQFSKAGNPMIVLQLEVTDGTNTATCFDQLVGISTCFWKIRQFCDATGSSALLIPDRTLTPEDCVNKSGSCRLEVEAEDQEKGYPAKHTVDQYKPAAFDPHQPDSIPF